MTIDRNKYPDVFIKNEQMKEDDINLFNLMLSQNISNKERDFFQHMKEKEEGEFAPSADILIDEHDNNDEIYFIRYYYEEYKIGHGLPGKRCVKAIYHDNLNETLKSDLFPLIGKHITFLDWLRENNFNGINYYGNTIFNPHNPG